MKKTLSILAVLIGAFFVWQWFLSRRHPALYDQAKEQEAGQKRLDQAQVAAMVKQPPLCNWSPLAALESVVANVVIPELQNGRFVSGQDKKLPTVAQRNPLLFGFQAN